MRVTFLLASIAAGLTAIGILLGLVWAKTEWGRWWSWDPKEAAALGVLVWSICFLLVHRLREATARAVSLLSILGNILVSLAWLGPFLISPLHSYGAEKYSVLLLTILISHLAFFLAGLAPARCLRQGKA